jgi:sugar/nucleoside kinase (ribokinase family)
LYDLVTVGHFTIDLIISPRIASPKPTLGGPPTYVSLAAVKLGAKVSVISKVGQDFSEDYVKWLKTNHVDLSVLEWVNDACTTRFVLRYDNNWKRKLQLKAHAPPISACDVPDVLKAKTINLAPITSELSEDLITKLRKSVSVLSLDPQGFVRDFDSKGNVHLKRWREKAVLELVDVYKSSQDEIKAITGTSDMQIAAKKIQDYGVKIVIITRGMRGSTLFFDDSLYNVPACKSRLVLDPTGAGDAFIGAFLAEYIRTKDPVWCACVGSASASFVVEGIGPERFGERQETYERAKEIYEKQLKK